MHHSSFFGFNYSDHQEPCLIKIFFPALSCPYFMFIKMEMLLIIEIYVGFRKKCPFTCIVQKVCPNSIRVLTGVSISLSSVLLDFSANIRCLLKLVVLKYWPLNWPQQHASLKICCLKILDFEIFLRCVLHTHFVNFL